VSAPSSGNDASPRISGIRGCASVAEITDAFAVCKPPGVFGTRGSTSEAALSGGLGPDLFADRGV
jgi:hypothetical protein